MDKIKWRPDEDSAPDFALNIGVWVTKRHSALHLLEGRVIDVNFSKKKSIFLTATAEGWP